MVNVDVDVLQSGAVLLGDCICCDGFKHGCPSRIQTHIHLDHMDQFETSKGFQNIFMSAPTRELLIAEYNADLSYRQNIIPLQTGVTQVLDNETIKLVPSGHMLGSVQVEATLRTGKRVGYSGDIQWPLEAVVEVEELVVDSTYGSSHSVRQYSQAEADMALLEVVNSKIKNGPVFIKAHRGTLQRALQVLCGNFNFPILGSKRLLKLIDVFTSNGYAIDPVTDLQCVEAKEVKKSNRYIQVISTGDSLPLEYEKYGTSIVLSAFLTKKDSPLIERSERSLSIALSDHADFWGTIEYIKATGAKRVLTDNTRGCGVELALEIKKLLDIEAAPSSQIFTKEWGR